MRVTLVGVGRRDWNRYLALRITGHENLQGLQARFQSALTKTIDVPLFQIKNSPSRSNLWVMTLPAVGGHDKQHVSLILPDGVVAWEKSFSSRSLNFLNSATLRLKPRLSKLLWKSDDWHREHGVFLELLGVYPYDTSSDVVRLRALYPLDSKPNIPTPDKLLIHGHATHMMVLEEGPYDQRSCQTVLSYRVRRDSGDLIFALGAYNDLQPGLLYLSEESHICEISAFADRTRDAAGDERYATWALSRRVTPSQLLQQRSRVFDTMPLVSVVVPVYLPDLAMLRECLSSICTQSYTKWELVIVVGEAEADTVSVIEECAHQDERIQVVWLAQNGGIVENTNAGIKAAHGDFIAFIDQDDVIEPDALYEYVSYINEHPNVSALYCDEDSFTDDLSKVFHPRLKPHFNRDALYSHNYIVHMLMVKASLLDQKGLSTVAVEGAQDYDLCLKASEAGPLGHVARVLYHWRVHDGSVNDNGTAKPYALKGGQCALLEHFARRGISVKVDHGESPFTYHVSYLMDHHPLVSVIIPTMDHTSLLDTCVTSLLDKAGWDNLEVLIVENNSKEPATFTYYDQLVDRDDRIRILRYEGPFNYSKIINYGVRAAKGEYLLLLNNDTEALSDNCVATLASYFQRPEVGIVGPLLLFPDGLVQTSGLALMRDARLGFLNQFLTQKTHGGYLGSLEHPRDLSAVLGAAQMVRRELFEAVGGYDEMLAVTYNDVDFCWRVREKEKLVVYTPYAQFSHREFASRGRDTTTAQKAIQTEREAEIMRAKWPSFFRDGDPELNPECDLASPWFALPDE